MAETGTAKLFRHGRSQAVRLPKEFRFPGKEVRVRRVGRGVLLEPMEMDAGHIRAIFGEVDRLGGADFLPEGRPEQPPMPPMETGIKDISAIFAELAQYHDVPFMKEGREQPSIPPDEDDVSFD